MPLWFYAFLDTKYPKYNCLMMFIVLMITHKKSLRLSLNTNEFDICDKNVENEN